MKKFLMLILLIPFLSCENESEENCGLVSCDYIGEWSWTSTYGSIAGSTWTPESTGEERTLIIDETEMSFFTNDSLVLKTNYEVFESDTILGDTIKRTFIKYDGWTRLLMADMNTLEMRDFCADCYDDFYERK